jgi:TolB protein
MTEPPSFDDAEPEQPLGAGGVRRWIVVGVVALLLVSTVFLAWVSGRGRVSVVPVSPAPSTAAAGTSGPNGPSNPPSPSTVSSAAATSTPAATSGTGSATARLAVVEADGSLFTMDRAGNGIVRRGGSDATYLFPAWSPDGGRVAAIAAGAGGGAIHVFPTAGGGSASPAPPTVIYQSADASPFYLYWSPDGRSVTFLTSEAGGGLALRSALADGAGPSTVVWEGSPMYWTWTGDRRLLVHSGGQGVGSFLGEVGPADGAGDPIGAASSAFRAPAVSSTGHYRAFAVPDGDTGLKVVAAATAGPGRQEVPAFGGAAFAFDPAGDRLAFIAATEPGTPPDFPVGPLRLLDPATGGLRTLLPGVEVAFFWSPDGQTIATIQAPAAQEPGASSSAVPARLVDTGVWVEVVFVDVATADVESTQEVQLADLFVSQFLPFFDQYALSHRLWTPDSRAVALPLVAADGSVNIAEVRADGSEPRTIAPGVAAFWSP